MRLLTSYIASALIGLLVAAPAKDENSDKVVITQSYYVADNIKYSGQHEIVNLIVPLNSLNFGESDSSESDELDGGVILFFVEADIQSDGSLVDQGLYVLKEGKATKILENGRDAAAPTDNSTLVFFGAKDGLYVYNETTNSADKYGPINDSIIAIAKEKEGDVIYILTEDGELYKVTNNGETKEKIKDVVKAQQIILDFSNNLYFYSDDKQPYVLTTDGVKKIDGFPGSLGSDVKLIKPPFALDEGIPFVVGNLVYALYPNGTSQLSDFEFKPKAKPTAYAPEGALIQYYAHDKKIYEFNLLKLILEAVVDELSNYLNSKVNDIRALASKLKSNAVH